MAVPGPKTPKNRGDPLGSFHQAPEKLAASVFGAVCCVCASCPCAAKGVPCTTPLQNSKGFYALRLSAERAYTTEAYRQPAAYQRDRCSPSNAMTAAFSSTTSKFASGGNYRQVTGDPDCAAFYAWILSELLKVTSKWQPPTRKLTQGQRGNLGEHISYLVAHHSGFSGQGYTPILGAALAPLQPGTTPGLDIVILYLDPEADPSKDRLFIQEVKTTGAQQLNYARILVSDYRKLFGTTASLTLASRMSYLKAKLFYEHAFPSSLLDRVEDLAQAEPRHCTNVRLLPTLVHNLASLPAARPMLDAVVADIAGLGWSPACIEAWSIALKRLNGCLIHLAKQKSFLP